MKKKLKSPGSPDFAPAQLKKWVNCGLNFLAWEEPSPFRSKVVAAGLGIASAKPSRANP